MSQLHDIETFLSLSRKVTNAAELRLIMTSIVREMGFDRFAMLHHVSPPPGVGGGNAVIHGDCVALTDYPDEWVEIYTNENLVQIDPVLLAAGVSPRSYAWENVPRLLALTPDQHTLIERGRSKGIVDGFSVPSHFVGEPIGSCSFALGPHRKLPRANFNMAEKIALLGFQVARDLAASEPARKSGSGVQLTGRQLECIVLVAKGKTDWEIARILGISEETVKQHIKDARERYDVAKRVQLVVRVLYDGLVGIRDLR